MVYTKVEMPEPEGYWQVKRAKLDEVKVPKIKDYWICLLSIKATNSSGIFQCAQGTNQVSGYNYDAKGIVKLHKSNYLVGFALPINHHHGWWDLGHPSQ